MILTPESEQTRYAIPIDNESLPNDLRFGSSVAKMVKTSKNVNTNSTENICQEPSWSWATDIPNGPIPEWPDTDTLNRKVKL